jgi:GT2 family glycosyltransferase
MYSEEADITNRMLKAGYKVVWCPQIKVLHLAHGRVYNEKLHRIRMESGRYYDKKYGLDSEAVFKREKKTLQIDILLSKILGMRKRADNSRKTLETLIKNHEEGLV